jgi:hypothetical protein
VQGYSWAARLRGHFRSRRAGIAWIRRAAGASEEVNQSPIDHYGLGHPQGMGMPESDEVLPVAPRFGPGLWPARRSGPCGHGLTAPEAVARLRPYLRRPLTERPAGPCVVRSLPSVRFSGECPGPHKSTAVHLIRPDDLIGHPGVQDRLHVSTAVVSTALAVGLVSGDPDLPPSRRGVKLARSLTPSASPMLDSMAVASYSRSRRAVWPITTLTLSDLLRSVAVVTHPVGDPAEPGVAALALIPDAVGYRFYRSA